MISISVYTAGLTVRVRASRWPSGARYPEVLHECTRELPGPGKGRDALRLAVAELSAWLEVLDGPAD